MRDFFRWPTNFWDAESLYFHSTLLRLLYARDNSLWQTLLDNFVGIRQVVRATAAGAFPISFAAVEGDTGTILLFEGTQNNWQRAGQVLLMDQSTLPEFPGAVSTFDSERERETRQTVNDWVFGQFTPPVLFCGHSLGGAVAQLASHRISRLSPSRFGGCVTFGSKKVGNPAFAQGTTFNLFNVINIADPVPRVTPPPLGVIVGVTNGGSVRPKVISGIVVYWHAGKLGFLDLDGQMTIQRGPEFIASGPPATETIHPPFYFDPTIHHYMSEYARRLRTRLDRLTSVSDLRRIVNRQTLDLLNLQLNSREGTDWRWDPNTGLPFASLINPNLPVPECGCGRV